jgi:hypothetical protein
MLDDIGGDPIVAKATNTAMSTPLQSCRHNSTTFILVVHEWCHSMTLQIRSLVNVVFLFRGLNPQQLSYMKRTVASNEDKFKTALARLESYLSRGRRACIRMDEKSIGVLTLATLSELDALTVSIDEEDSDERNSE